MSVAHAELPEVHTASAPDAALRSTLPIWIALHIPLGLYLAVNPTLSTLHALASVAIGVLFALDPRRPDRVACVLAYIAGADVLWRMTGATVFHQFGKYGVAVVASLALLRSGRVRGLAAPVLYLALLVPSVSLVTDIAGYQSGIIGLISFNLSGPISLACSIAFFRQIELDWREMTAVLLALAMGTTAVFVVALRSTLLAGSIQFTGESNFVTSGGFGPNQVSAMLGLGALAFAVAAICAPRRMLPTSLLWLGACALLTQCLLTLSRGGAYAAIGALLVAFPFLAVNRAQRNRALLRFGAVAAVIALIAVPVLDTFTGGALEARFGDRRLAGRDILMLRDISVWQENPFFGVGPGMSRLSRVEGFNVTLAHTEFTRLVAEHGLCGLLALALLIGMIITHIRAAAPGAPRFLAVALSAWSLLFMIAVAFRLSGPSLCLGLAAVLVRDRGPGDAAEPGAP